MTKRPAPSPPRPTEAGCFVREPHETEWRKVDDQPLLLPPAEPDPAPSPSSDQ